MQRMANKNVYDTIPEMVEPKRTALVVVDMQNEFCSPKGIPAQAGIDVSPVMDIVPLLRDLIACARAAGIRVIYLRQTHERDLANVSPARLSFYLTLYGGKISPYHAIKGTWGHEVISELTPLDGEIVINKDRSSGFIATNLDLILRSNGIETTVITGMATHACVESTARDSGFFDYYTVVVTDGVADYSEELHKASLLTMSQRCHMTTVEELTKIWNIAKSEPALDKAAATG